METTTQRPNRIHPLVATAAGAVIVASTVAVAAMTGILPKAHGNDNPSAQPVIAQAASAPASLPVQQGAVQAEPHAPARPRVASRPPRAEPRYTGEYQQQAAIDRNVGTVESITPVTQQGHGTGLGAVGGAVAGGLLGNQIGRGNGRTAATIIGALGGGVAGNVVEQRMRSETDYEVNVRMGDGSVRTMTYHQQPNLAIGQRVRVDGDTIVGAV